jgi:hypothetical protein
MLNIYSMSFDHSLNGFAIDIQQSHRGLLVSSRVSQHSPDVITLNFCSTLAAAAIWHCGIAFRVAMN